MVSFDPITPDLLATITEQLARRPLAVLGVAACCPAGHPSVAVTYPLRPNTRLPAGVEPFPTLYWLTCPALRRTLSHLERDGAIVRLESELGQDGTLRDQLRDDHRRYAAERWSLLSDDDRAKADAAGYGPVLRQSGIGGQQELERSRLAIKCLHMHVAQHLACGNTLGRLILQRFEIQPCRPRPVPGSGPRNLKIPT